ncbi:MAG: amidinotransferase [Planctomycetes bacterium]|nr:amidinotransferase [Planctomycetota bacterium]
METWPRRAADCRQTPRLGRVLMADPAAFDVVDAQNAHMRDAAGELNIINKKRAREQWESLAAAYRRAGIDVSILDAEPGLPDFCFAANPSFVLPLPDGGREMWLSKMAHASRRGEVAAHAAFARKNNINIREMPAHVPRFEGTGDAMLHPGRFLLHAGVGPRSTRAAWDALADAHPDLDILIYQLHDERFYHLDTALAPLDENTALIVPQAFDGRGLKLIKSAFASAFEIPIAESLQFAGNAHCPDGRHVILQKGCVETERWLRSRGFEPVPVETGEFIKSGGSVFCLKLAW